MAVLPVIANTWRCSIQGTQTNGGSFVNVVHMRWKGAGTPTSSDITTLDTSLIRLWAGTDYSSGHPWLYQCPSTTKLVQATYLPLDGTGLAYSVAHTNAGAGAGSSLPQECAPVLTLRTNYRGRRYRGRIYFPAPVQAATSADGTLTAAVATATVAQWNGMVAAVTANWEPVVASYGHSITKAGPVSWSPFATTITAATMDVFVDVQRRRKF